MIGESGLETVVSHGKVLGCRVFDLNLLRVQRIAVTRVRTVRLSAAEVT